MLALAGMPSPSEPIELSGLCASAVSAIVTLLCCACRGCWPRARARKSPLHLQEVVPIEEASYEDEAEQTVQLPSIGSSIYNSLVTALCYAVAVGTAATAALEDGSISVALERSVAFVVLGACTEAELWQGLRDGDEDGLRRLLWRARALLRCAAAAALSVAWLRPLWPQLSSGEAPPTARLALGVASGVVAVAFALSACAGAGSSVENAAPPPPLRTSPLLPKLLFGFWTKEVRAIVAVDRVAGGAPLAVAQLPQLDARQLAAECWRLGATARARRESAVRGAAAGGGGLSSPLSPHEASKASKARSLLPELWSVVRTDVRISCAWAALCLVAQYAAPLGMLLLIDYVAAYDGGAVAPRRQKKSAVFGEPELATTASCSSDPSGCHAALREPEPAMSSPSAPSGMPRPFRQRPPQSTPSLRLGPSHRSSRAPSPLAPSWRSVRCAAPSRTRTRLPTAG